MAANTGTIVDVLMLAKRNYPNDVAMQAKYVQKFLDVINRDYRDEIKSLNVSYKHYSVLLTMFPSDGMVWCVWELYSGAMQEGLGVESIDIHENTNTLYFSSSPYIKDPIVNEILNQ
jgi:hypothetical protein